jgi:hypothetical protein
MRRGKPSLLEEAAHKPPIVQRAAGVLDSIHIRIISRFQIGHRLLCLNVWQSLISRARCVGPIRGRNGAYDGKKTHGVCQSYILLSHAPLYVGPRGAVDPHRPMVHGSSGPFGPIWVLGAPCRATTGTNYNFECNGRRAPNMHFREHASNFNEHLAYFQHVKTFISTCVNI